MRTIHSHLPILFSLVLGLLFLGSCETDNYSDSLTEAPLYQTHYRLYHDSGSLPIDISGLPTGTYIITLQADGKTVLHQKLIKK